MMMISKISSWSWWWDWEEGSNSTTDDKVTCRLVVSVLVVLVASWYVIRRSMRNGNLPPGPRGLPLVGNLLSLKPDLHLYFAELAQVYGPVMKLQLGRKFVLVLSSSSPTKEVFRDLDSTFANRDPPIAGLVLTYGGMDIGWSSSNPEWRKLRKVAHELLSNTNLDSLYALRRQEVQQTVRDLYYKIETPVNISEQVYITMNNVIMSMLWGRTLPLEERTRVEAEFRHVATGMVDLTAKPNVSDVFPVLRWFDIQGIEREAKALLGRTNRIFKSVIDQHMKMDEVKLGGKGSNKKDILQLLLELMEQSHDAKTQITMNQLKALFLDIVVAGMDPTSATLEWAMTEMMQHPEIMRKAQEELDEVVGMNNMVEESHLSKLHYLDAIMKETFRLHPVAPFLVPHSTSSSCTVGGYTVPKGAAVVFNVWAIHRDPKAWEDPLDFQPERFLGDLEKIDYGGNNFNYLPFGSGRRMCVGIPLVERLIKHALASLLHSFKWRLPEGTKLDLTEKFGIVLTKSTPLVAIPTPRLLNLELYN